jgi:hypothetical protein
MAMGRPSWLTGADAAERLEPSSAENRLEPSRVENRAEARLGGVTGAGLGGGRGGGGGDGGRGGGGVGGGGGGRDDGGGRGVDGRGGGGLGGGGGGGGGVGTSSGGGTIWAAHALIAFSVCVSVEYTLYHPWGSWGGSPTYSSPAFHSPPGIAGRPSPPHAQNANPATTGDAATSPHIRRKSSSRAPVVPSTPPPRLDGPNAPLSRARPNSSMSNGLSMRSAT